MMIRTISSRNIFLGSQILYFVVVSGLAHMNWQNDANLVLVYGGFATFTACLILFSGSSLFKNEYRRKISPFTFIIMIVALIGPASVEFIVATFRLSESTGDLFTFLSGNLNNPSTLIEIVMAALPVPFIETMTFQGTIQTYTQHIFGKIQSRKVRNVLTVLSVSILFALSHAVYEQNFDGLLDHWMAGLVFAAAFLRTNSLGTVFILHGTTNLMVSIMLLFFPS
jgi:membrane protease YdiL (CAAX protease family)